MAVSYHHSWKFYPHEGSGSVALDVINENGHLFLALSLSADMPNQVQNTVFKAVEKVLVERAITQPTSSFVPQMKNQTLEWPLNGLSDTDLTSLWNNAQDGIEVLYQAEQERRHEHARRHSGSSNRSYTPFMN